MLARFEKFTFDVFSIYHHLHKIMADEMNRYGLRGPYAIYLIAMSRNDSGITSARLSEICCRNKSDVSRAVADFERKNMIERRGSGTYNAMLFLTDYGKEVADQIARKAMNITSSVDSGLDDEKRDILYTTIDTIAKSMEALSKNGISDI